MVITRGWAPRGQPHFNRWVCLRLAFHVPCSSGLRRYWNFCRKSGQKEKFTTHWRSKNNHKRDLRLLTQDTCLSALAAIRSRLERWILPVFSKLNPRENSTKATPYTCTFKLHLSISTTHWDSIVRTIRKTSPVLQTPNVKFYIKMLEKFVPSLTAATGGNRSPHGKKKQNFFHLTDILGSSGMASPAVTFHFPSGEHSRQKKEDK